MNIVISGASGRLGGTVADLLLDRVDPAELILVTRTPDTLAAAARRGAQGRLSPIPAGSSRPSVAATRRDRGCGHQRW